MPHSSAKVNAHSHILHSQSQPFMLMWLFQIDWMDLQYPNLQWFLSFNLYQCHYFWVFLVWLLWRRFLIWMSPIDFDANVSMCFFFPLLVLRSYYTMGFRTSSTWNMYNFLTHLSILFHFNFVEIQRHKRLQDMNPNFKIIIQLMWFDLDTCICVAF